MQRILYKGAVYREAGVYDFLAKKVLAPLWKWIAKLGLSKQDVFDFFNDLLDKYSGVKNALKSTQKIQIPQAIIQWIAKLLVSTGMDRGQFLLALDAELDNPPAGYDWQVVDTLGTQKLVQVGIEALPEEQQFKSAPIISGSKFDDAILISVWWATRDPNNIADVALRAYIQSSDGDIFWEAPNVPPYVTQTQFGGFVVVPRIEANSAASALCKLARDAAYAGNSSKTAKDSYKLAAVYLSGLAKGDPITNSDKVKLVCVDSIKFNWEFTLPDILMGRIREFKKFSNSSYERLVAELQRYANR